MKKCYTIKGIVHIVKNNKLMELYHLKDLQELFPFLTTLIMLNIYFCFRKFPVLLNVRSSYSSAFLVLNSGPTRKLKCIYYNTVQHSRYCEILVSCWYLYINVIIVMVSIYYNTVRFPLESFSVIQLCSTLFFKFGNPYNC